LDSLIQDDFVPPPNPGNKLIDRYRASFWHHLKKQSTFYVDTAYLFGIVPMKRVGRRSGIDDSLVHINFNFIFTTGLNTLHWRVIRSIESVFYHNPNAKVVVHSNTLPVTGSKLDTFWEAGYDLQVKPYDVNELLKDWSSGKNATDLVELFLSRKHVYKKGPFWYSHETDLLRYLLMWKYGGVYLDTDMYIQRPISKNFTNVLGKQSKEKTSLINGAAMIFDKSRHPFFDEAIKQYLKTYVKEVRKGWGCVGPNLITSVVRHLPSKVRKTINVLDNQAFQPIHHQEIAKFCHSAPYETYSSILDSSNPKLLTIHLNSKLTGMHQTFTKGSVCDEILSRHCIFCDESH